MTDMPSNQEAEEAYNEHMAKLFDALNTGKTEESFEDAEAKLETLQAENAQLKEELAKPYDLGVSQLQYDLGNILACIHRDGGHYQIEHGTKKAVTDAVAIICEWRNAFDELATEQGKSFTLGQCLDESRKELAEIRKQEPVAYANEHFELILDGPDSCAIIKFQRDEKMKYTYPFYVAPVAKVPDGKVLVPKSCITHLIDQVDRCNFIDDHGHQLKMNQALINLIAAAQEEGR